MCVCVCERKLCGCNIISRGRLLTCAGHGGWVCLGTEEALIAGTGCGALAHRVAVWGTLGAAVVGGQGPVVANLTGCKWRQRDTDVIL